MQKAVTGTIRYNERKGRQTFHCTLFIAYIISVSFTCKATGANHFQFINIISWHTSTVHIYAMEGRGENPLTLLCLYKRLKCNDMPSVSCLTLAHHRSNHQQRSNERNVKWTFYKFVGMSCSQSLAAQNLQPLALHKALVFGISSSHHHHHRVISCLGFFLALWSCQLRDLVMSEWVKRKSYPPTASTPKSSLYLS